VKSMTGYGRETAALDALAVTVQVSSVNRRSLDLAINLPEEWRELEAVLAEQVRQVASRGRISVVVELDGQGRQAGAAWDEDAAAAVLDRLQSSPPGRTWISLPALICSGRSPTPSDRR